MEMPKEILKWGNCLLLHKKTPIMTGKIIWDKTNKEWIREIKYICKICFKEEE